jgi:hypothetical protein
MEHRNIKTNSGMHLGTYSYRMVKMAKNDGVAIS